MMPIFYIRGSRQTGGAQAAHFQVEAEDEDAALTVANELYDADRLPWEDDNPFLPDDATFEVEQGDHGYPTLDPEALARAADDAEQDAALAARTPLDDMHAHASDALDCLAGGNVAGARAHMSAIVDLARGDQSPAESERPILTRPPEHVAAGAGTDADYGITPETRAAINAKLVRG